MQWLGQFLWYKSVNTTIDAEHYTLPTIRFLTQVVFLFLILNLFRRKVMKFYWSSERRLNLGFGMCYRHVSKYKLHCTYKVQTTPSVNMNI